MDCEDKSLSVGSTSTIPVRHTALSHLTKKNFIFLIFIISIVFTFNFDHIMADLLWHDDGAWYYLASEGNFASESRGKIASLAPYRHNFYAYRMLDWGLPMIRSTFVLIMSLTSISLYFLYTKSFGLTDVVALPAALLPNILPSLIGIPMGLNASYAVWGLLPILLCLNLINVAYTKTGALSYGYWALGFIAYAVGLNLTPSANFLIPVVLFFLRYFF